MKANELKIKNFVYDFNDRVCSIDEIKMYNLRLSTLDGGYKQESTKMEYCKPIPLTEEWLLKFGFKQDEYDANTFNHSIFEYKLSDNRFFNHLCKLTEIKYVHELQNLYFALTNEELTIKQQ